VRWRRRSAPINQEPLISDDELGIRAARHRRRRRWRRIFLYGGPMLMLIASIMLLVDLGLGGRLNRWEHFVLIVGFAVNAVTIAGDRLAYESLKRRSITFDKLEISDPGPDAARWRP